MSWQTTCTRIARGTVLKWLCLFSVSVVQADAGLDCPILFSRKINRAKNKWAWTNETQWLIWRSPTEIFYKALSLEKQLLWKTNSVRRSMATWESTMVNALYLWCAFTVAFEHSVSELKHVLGEVKIQRVSSSSCTEIIGHIHTPKFQL